MLLYIVCIFFPIFFLLLFGLFSGVKYAEMHFYGLTYTQVKHHKSCQPAKLACELIALSPSFGPFPSLSPSDVPSFSLGLCWPEDDDINVAADGNDDHDNHVKTKPKPKPPPHPKSLPWTCLGHNKNTKQCSCLQQQHQQQQQLQQQQHQRDAAWQCNQNGNNNYQD